ncbi:MAG: hypothetical protein FJX72_16505 [Armatimonadetes bacterium]|nr:hypothetical protein [Armatimonadota bacterium]
MPFHAGDTFLITDPNGRKQHLRIVLTEPSGSPPTIVTVQLNTATEISDKTTVLEPGDHPFCTRRSVVSYDTMQAMEALLIEKLARMETMVKDPLFIRHDPCHPGLLDRIVKGAFASPMTTPRMAGELRRRLPPTQVGFGAAL